MDDGAGPRDSAVVYYAPPRRGPAAEDKALVQELRSSNPRAPPGSSTSRSQAQWPFYCELDGTRRQHVRRAAAGPEGARWIATRRLSKPDARTDLSFRLAGAADVFVMITRGHPLPPGLLRAGFRDTGAGGRWRDNELRRVPYALYARTAAGGERVTVRGATADYVVLVRASR